MKVALYGGDVLLGPRLLEELRLRGHAVTAHSPATGVDAVTREGLTWMLSSAEVVVDLTGLAHEDASLAPDLLPVSTQHLLDAGAIAGVRQHVALSHVASDRLADSSYFGARVAQEQLIRASAFPCAIVKSTLSFDLLAWLADASTLDQGVRIAPALVQPVDTTDVAVLVADVVEDRPAGAMWEIAGPERMRLTDAVRRLLDARHDTRAVIVDPHARYLGAELDERALLPSACALTGSHTFTRWLGRLAAKP